VAFRRQGANTIMKVKLSMAVARYAMKALWRLCRRAERQGADMRCYLATVSSVVIDHAIAQHQSCGSV
jgi:hypothetical protein